MSQDVFLFHGTVLENIAYGSFNASHNEIIHVAKLASVHEFILQLPQGYDSILGERGQKLSGGQRQFPELEDEDIQQSLIYASILENN